MAVNSLPPSRNISIRTLSSIPYQRLQREKILNDIIYHVEDFVVQNFAATFFENFDFVIENLQFTSMQILQLTCFPLNFQGTKKKKKKISFTMSN